MGQRALHAVHHGDVQDGVQPLGAEIGLGGRRQLGQDGAGAGVGAEGTAERGEVRHQQRQQAGRDGGVHQQRLGGTADAGAAHLGVGQDGARHGRVGTGVDVGVAEPLGMGEHRHPRLRQHARHQPLAAARDDEVDQPGGPQHRAHEGAVLGGGQLHRILRQPGLAQALAQAVGDGVGGARALAAAAQDHGAAGLEAEPAGIGGDVGPALEDHADHAERLRHAADHQAVRPRPFGQGAADRVRQGRDLLQPLRHRLHARRGQHQPVAEGGGEAGRGGEVGGVGAEDRGCARAQGRGGRAQGSILGGRGRAGQPRGGGAGGLAGKLDQAGMGIGRHVHGAALLAGRPHPIPRASRPAANHANLPTGVGTLCSYTRDIHFA